MKIEISTDDVNSIIKLIQYSIHTRRNVRTSLFRELAEESDKEKIDSLNSRMKELGEINATHQILSGELIKQLVKHVKETGEKLK